MLTLEGSDLPKKVQNISDPPNTLYVLGKDICEYKDQPSIAVVGSRRVSAYGRHVTEKLAGELARDGVIIISGLALGVDSIAHKAALDNNGTTIAVLPGGIGRIYPRTHEPLARAIIKGGGSVVSERQGTESPMQHEFLVRNRLISALSDGVLITEAAIRSGSLNTARHALEQGKTVFAVPGNITSELSEGTNSLIKMGAVPVTSTEDIYTALKWKTLKEKKPALAYTLEEGAIIGALKGKDAVSGEELLASSGLDNTLFFETMTMLEINGVVKPLGANLWTLV